MRVRVKFSKSGVMKFIGHLDVMRYFQKAIRRADIDIAYTEGFSPHMILSFAAPLGVGLTSNGEYADIMLKTPISSAEAVRRLNDVMVEGMEIVSFREIPDEKASNAMSLVAEADYTVIFREGMEPPAGWEEKLLAFYEKPSILVTKKTKKSEREMDLKPLIYALSVSDGKIFMTLSTGSTDNIKPELVMEAFCREIGYDLPAFALLINREEVYAEGHVSLEDLGKDIG